jgi:hypothetical protein
MPKHRAREANDIATWQYDAINVSVQVLQSCQHDHVAHKSDFIGHSSSTIEPWVDLRKTASCRS